MDPFARPPRIAYCPTCGGWGTVTDEPDAEPCWCVAGQAVALDRARTSGRRERIEALPDILPDRPPPPYLDMVARPAWVGYTVLSDLRELSLPSDDLPWHATSN